MDTLILSQWQFAITSIYHFFFVPLTLGLSLMVAVIETIYVRTGNETYKRMAKFWGKLFLINFAMGVVTGIVMEFQFGMNWSQYARYVGDVFGAPLAIEALLAFFLESTFLGIWIFGWDKLSKPMHAAAIWLVALGSNISALWILIANSFMQEPVGYQLGTNGRAVMTDFGALLTNPNVWVQFPHVVSAGLTTGAFFVIGICGYHLLRKKEMDFFRRSINLGAIFGVVGVVLVILVGHSQTQHVVQNQPMKLAGIEALWETEDPASFSVFSILDVPNKKDIVQIRIPRLLSLLAYNSLDGKVQGMNELQAQYETKYGPGNYIPPVFFNYWTFRIMVGAGMLMLLLVAVLIFLAMRNRLERSSRFLKYIPLAILLPYIANTAGWMLTEMGRQPWVVFGLLKTRDAVSPNVSPGVVLASLIVFALVYGVLMVVDGYLLQHFAKLGPVEETADRRAGDEDF